jgi:AcrR family transcriptional regulator
VAYEATKHINGRDYRYRVERVKDPQSGQSRSRWHYLGRVDDEGELAPARSYAVGVSRDDLIVATARLLQSRDASRITVAVIAHHAGISTGTFYRHFHDRRSALEAAVAYLGSEMIRDLPPLTGRIGSRAAERERLSRWFSALHAGALEGRAFRWALTRTGRERAVPALEASSPGSVLRSSLAAYLGRLHERGVAEIADPDALAGALMRLHLAFARDLASTDDPGAASLWWNEVFPVIERAVFPHLDAAA